MEKKGIHVFAVVAGTLAVLSLTFWFAPALIDFLESLSGKSATIEIVVRANFLTVFFQLIVIYFGLLFIYPVKNFKKRILLYFLSVEAIVLCSIWIFDRTDHYYWSEESALTFFSAVVLILCSAASALNIFYLKILNKPNKHLKTFWLFVTAAFLYAGIDEFFMIHERIGRMFRNISWAGDLETACYGIGALVFVAIFYKPLKNELFRKDAYFFRLLLTGIFCFMLSSIVDSFDFLVADIVNRYILYYSPLNSIEETLEFTAATLFLSAFVLNLLEVNEHRLLDLATASTKPYAAGTALKRCYLGAAIAICTVFIGSGAAYRLKDEPIIAEQGYKVSVFADISDGLNRPDGLLYSPNPGLILANGNKASNILVFDLKGNGHVFADAGSGLVSPEGMAIWNKVLFVADDSGRQVLKYDGTGALTDVVTGSNFKSPDGVAVDAQGNLYIADQKLALIFKMVGDRRQLLASSLAGLKEPNEMVFDDKGNLYVTDEMARAVFKISPEGKTTMFVDPSRGLANPRGITFHDGEIYVTDSKTGIIYRFNTDGSGGKFLSFAKKYRGLSGIAFDDRDNLYVVSADPNSISGYIFRIEPGQAEPGSRPN